MSLIFAIDPGNTESAWVVYDTAARRPLDYAKDPNDKVLEKMPGMANRWARCVIEMVGHYGTGMPAGREIFDTCRWIGRFEQAWHTATQGNWPTLVMRKVVAVHVTGSARAKDSNVRQALIDRWGGDRLAIGGIRCRGCGGKGWRGRDHTTCPACGGSGWAVPRGPLHGISKDVWQALAVAVTAAEHFPLAVA